MSLLILNSRCVFDNIIQKTGGQIFTLFFFFQLLILHKLLQFGLRNTLITTCISKNRDNKINGLRMLTYP